VASVVREQRELNAMRFLPLIGLIACAEPLRGENGDDWYDPGSDLDVEEPMVFTDVPYDFPANPSDGIGFLLSDLFPIPAGSPGSDRVAWGADDVAGRTSGCQRFTVSELPFEIEAIATIHPKYYFKTSGCDWDSDEKYYGSFFLQDGTGGVFILGDTKVAHFEPGDRVRIRARAAKTSFGLNMIYAWDGLEVVEENVPIYYEEPTGTFATMASGGNNPTGRVFRVTGEVVVPKDTFGEFTIEDDLGRQFSVGLDVELNRRGVDYPMGTRITVTGPVLYSFSVYTIVVMRVGQITVEE
jgi:hypothetical protein